MLQTNFRASHDDGFSLIELAIVLLIIGLIVGGILKGQELIESARLRSLINQIQEYRTATSIFMEKYGSLPGDYDKAKLYFNKNLTDGNNNGIIDSQGSSSQGHVDETASFWAHLAAAGLIASPDAPTTKLGGIITIHHGNFETPRHWFVVSARHDNTVDGALLTPAQAMSIDQKIDSGNPVDGYFRAADGTNSDGGKCLTSHNLYNIKNTKPACIVYFVM